MNSTYASLLLILNVLLASYSQILLKKSANKVYSKKIYEILNINVIIAYGIFFATTLVNLFLFKYVELNSIMLLESFGYIFVPTLSYLILKEKLSRKQLSGIIVILFGILLYTL